MTDAPESPLPDTLLEVEDLAKYFPIQRGLLNRTVGHIKAVDGVSFTIRRGRDPRVWWARAAAGRPRPAG